MEYSIFIGDLALSTTSDDLFALFKNPALGMRPGLPDRPTKDIPPFQSCTGAHVMLDGQGVSRGFGFVRFTDHKDQKRALKVMSGVYCGPRPMRVAPAAARLPPSARGSHAVGRAQGVSDIKAPLPRNHIHFLPVTAGGTSTPLNISVTANADPPSVSFTTPSLPSGSSNTTSPFTASLASPESVRGNTIEPSQQKKDLGQSYSFTDDTSALTELLAPSTQSNVPSDTPSATAEQFRAWLAAQAIQAMESLAVGPTEGIVAGHDTQRLDIPQAKESKKKTGFYVRDEQEEIATAQDEYNTTVFIGNLNSTVTEPVLLDHFSPFGAIHYVKVPPGKNCGFVQFVTKGDARDAIEKMNGQMIGNCKMRLTWGRSGYQAALSAEKVAANITHIATRTNPHVHRLADDQATRHVMNEVPHIESRGYTRHLSALGLNVSAPTFNPPFNNTFNGFTSRYPGPRYNITDCGDEAEPSSASMFDPRPVTRPTDIFDGYTMSGTVPYSVSSNFEPANSAESPVFFQRNLSIAPELLTAAANVEPSNNRRIGRSYTLPFLANAVVEARIPSTDDSRSSKVETVSASMTRTSSAPGLVGQNLYSELKYPLSDGDRSPVLGFDPVKVDDSISPLDVPTAPYPRFYSQALDRIQTMPGFIRHGGGVTHPMECGVEDEFELLGSDNGAADKPAPALRVSQSFDARALGVSGPTPRNVENGPPISSDCTTKTVSGITSRLGVTTDGSGFGVRRSIW